MDKTPQQLRRERIKQFQQVAEKNESVPEIMLHRWNEGLLMLYSPQELTAELLEDILFTVIAYIDAVNLRKQNYKRKKLVYKLMHRMYKFFTPRLQRKKAERLARGKAKLYQRLKEQEKKINRHV